MWPGHASQPCATHSTPILSLQQGRVQMTMVQIQTVAQLVEPSISKGSIVTSPVF